MKIIQGSNLIVAGYVPSDAQQRTTPTGKELVEFSVKASEEDEKAVWVKCTAWSPSPLYDCAVGIRKGDFAMAAGTFTVTDYNGKQYVNMKCEYINFCGAVGAAPVSANAPAHNPPADFTDGFAEVKEDELPF